jgi:hypothetical protein
VVALAGTGRLDEALIVLNDAIAAQTAREQGVLFWGLRIALSVPRLKVRQGAPPTRRGRSSRRSTINSPKALRPRTCRLPAPCLRSCRRRWLYAYDGWLLPAISRADQHSRQMRAPLWPSLGRTSFGHRRGRDHPRAIAIPVIISGAKIVREDNGLTSDGGKCGYKCNFQTAAPFVSVMTHLLSRQSWMIATT